MSTFTSLKADDVRRNTATPSTRPGKFQHRVIEGVEDLDTYHLGGYHPLQIEDELHNGRYRLADKLGDGGYSIIWLARDLRMANYVAVIVTTADASVYLHERSLLLSLGNSLCRPGQGIVPTLLDEFCVAGPNGRHRCLVTQPSRVVEKWNRRSEWFNENGQFDLKPEMSRRRTLDQRFEYCIQEPLAEAGLNTVTVE